jgi:hypothetical protein
VSAGLHGGRQLVRGLRPRPTGDRADPLPWVFPATAITGFALFQSFSLTVTLGQDYLPNWIGASSGVTLGLAISIGGMLAPRPRRRDQPAPRGHRLRRALLQPDRAAGLGGSSGRAPFYR